MNKNLLFLLLSIPFLFLVGCDDNDPIQDLTLSQTLIFLKNGGNRMDTDSSTVMILTGNGGYSIVLEEGVENLVSAAIVNNNSIEFKSNEIEGKATFLLRDKLGKEKQITIYVEKQYFLLEVNSYTVEIKAADSNIENLLEKEILADKPFVSGNILELVSPNEKDGFRIYDSMSDAIVGEVKERGTFELTSHAPHLSLVFGNKEENFDLLGSVTPAIYLYFGIEMTSDKSISLKSTPPPVERLGYDLTAKYQEKYPNANIEYARIIIWTRPYLYKYMPVN